MAKMDAKMGTPTIKSDAKAYGDVTGIMSLVGDKAKGSIALSFTKPVIFELMHRILGAESEEIDDMSMDMAGELANMVAGVTKRLLSNQGYDFSLSLPSVVLGDNHVVTHKFDGKKFVLPYSTDSGTFSVEFCFEE
jgi:chemotaxis protein CheX